MSDPITQVAQAKDPNRGDEIFSTLRFDGIENQFSVSVENTWEGDWVYRIYSPFDNEKWKRISEREYMGIKNILKATADMINAGNDIGGQNNANKLLALFARHFQ